MTKEKLDFNNVKKDLLKVLKLNASNTCDLGLTYIFPTLTVALAFGIFLNIWIALLLALYPAYHIMRLVMDMRQKAAEKNALRNAIGRGDFSVSVEILSHISDETIYEPHSGYRHTHLTREVKYFNFESGARWRVPNGCRHYEWSKDYCMSTEGLDNTSTKGKPFYFITLKGNTDIAYIYNTQTLAGA